MRDILVSLFILGSLPTCFRRPFIGVVMFTLLAYMRLQDLTWGFARFQRWSYYVALVTIAGFLLTNGDKRFMVPDLRCWIMVLLVFIVGASLLASTSLAPHDFPIYLEFCKIIGVAVFTTAVVKNRDYLRVLVWVIALSFGFYGVKNGLAMIASGGSMVILQGPGGMLSDNNDFALALCMSIPMLLHLGLAEQRKLMRRATIAMVPLTMLTVMATHSRGAFLSMCLMIMVLVWRSQNRVAGFSVAFLIALAGVLAAPKSYVDRISTISTYEQDGSAVGRIQAWKVAGNMIRDRPLLGVGFNKFQQNYRRYDSFASWQPEGLEGTRVAHNSYLQIWAECGTPAFILYLLLMLMSFLDLWKLRREAEQRYHSSWILSYATMFEASLVAFCVGSFFLNRAHFDLFYHFVAIIVVFGRIAREAMNDPIAYPTRTSERGRLVLRRNGGFEAALPRSGFAPAPRVSGFARSPAMRGY